MRRTRRAVLGAAAGVVALSGCLGDDESDEETPASDSDDEAGSHDDGSHNEDGPEHDIEPVEHPVEHAEVAMVSDDGHHFEPHLVWIESGGL